MIVENTFCDFVLNSAHARSFALSGNTSDQVPLRPLSSIYSNKWRTCRGDYSSRLLAKNRPISKIAAHFLMWSDICQIKKSWMYTVVLACVAVVVYKQQMFCCWETNKPDVATVHHGVNKHFEVRVKGMLASCLTSMSDQLFS